MARTRTRRARRSSVAGTTRRKVDRLRADVGSTDVLEAFADVRMGVVVELGLVLDAFEVEEVGYRPDRGDLLDVRTHGVDARGTLERHPTPDGEGLVPVLRVDDLALLLVGSDPFPTGRRLDAAGFLYATHLAWDRFHGMRVRGAHRRWRVGGMQRRDVDPAADPKCAIVRTPLTSLPAPEELDDRSFVELDLRRP